MHDWHRMYCTRRHQSGGASHGDQWKPSLPRRGMETRNTDDRGLPGELVQDGDTRAAEMNSQFPFAASRTVSKLCE